ncbi:MAG: hypothetical protein WC315_03875, partial [Candidatus Omnitrophota bacterium]
MSLRITRQYYDALGLGDSKLRTTRQYIDTLGQGDGAALVSRQFVATIGSDVGEARVSRQYVEVLTSLTPDYYATSDDLTFNETADGVVNHIVTDSLIFNDYATTPFFQTVNDTLVLFDWPYRVRYGATADELEFIDNTWVFNIIQDFWPTGDFLTFDELVDVECGNWKFIPQTLTFTETIEWHGPHYVEIAHYISFQEIFWNNNNWRRTVNDILTLTQFAGRPISLTISDNLVFAEDGRRRIDAVDSLIFNELVLQGKGAPVTELLEFEQEVDVKGSFIRVVAENLNLGQAVAYYYITPCVDKQYRPFVGESDVLLQPTAPDINPPVVQGLPANARFQLIYPAAGGETDSMTLRAPELDSRDRSAFTRVNRETRGGRLVVYADPIWPKVTTIACTFVGLTKTEMLTLQEFVLSHIGEEIKVVDWEGRGWRGVVIKPNDPATCDGKDRWSIGFEFEGSRITDYDSGLSLIFSDTASNIVLRRPVITDSLIFNQEA